MENHTFGRQTKLSVIKNRFKYVILLLLFFVCGTNTHAQNCLTCSSTYSTLTNGLVLCLPFNGGNVNDQTASAFPGSVMNGPIATTDRLGNANGAFQFGTNKYIRYGDILDTVFSKAPTAKFSVSGWFKGTAPTGSNRSVIVGKSAGGGGPYQWYIYWDNDGKLVGATCSAANGPTNYIEQKSQTALANNIWYHFVYIFDGSLSQLSRCKLYVNAVAGQGQTPVGSLGTTTVNTAQEITIGAGHASGAPGTPNNTLNGTVDDIRIYNRALTTAEINELYNGTPLQITPMPDVGVCLGDSVQLTSSGGVSYAWFPSTNLSAANIANPYCKPTANRTYYITVTSGSCNNKDTINVSLNQNCCVLASSVSANNNNLLYYVPINNEARDVSTTPASPSLNGTGIGLNIDRFGNKNSSYTFTNVTTDKLITSAVPKLTFAAATSFSISTWVYPRSIRSVASRILTIFKNGGYDIILSPSTPAADAGKIAFQDYDGATSTTKVLLLSDSVITLNKWSLITVTVDKADSSNKLYINGRLTAQIKAVNSTQTTCGVSIGNHNINPLGFDGLIDEVRIYNFAMSQDNISDLYNQGRALILNQDTTICSGDSVNLRVFGNASTYSWSPTTGLSNPNIAEPTAKPLTTTTYILTSSNGGCTFKDTVIITVNIAAANAGVDTTICPGDSIQLYGSGGTNFQWSPSTNLSATNISNPYAKPSNTSDYVLRVTTATCTSTDTMRIFINVVNADAGSNIDLCYGDSIKLHATGGTSYQWSPFSTLSNYLDSMPYAKPLVNTTYRVIVTNGFCNDVDSVKVNVIQINADAGTQQQICPGDSIQLNASGGLSYAWLNTAGISDTTSQNPYVKPSTTSWFYVYAKNGSCKVIDSVNVIVASTLTADAGVPQRICRGESAQLNASGGLTFDWSIQPKWLDNPAIANPVATPDSTIEYIVIATSGNCTASDTVLITVDQLPVVMAGNDTFACKGQPFQLTPIIINANDYTWSPAGSVDNANSPYPNATIYGKTEFKIVAKNLITGCQNADSLWLDISTPSAGFNISASAGNVPFKVQTTNVSTPLPLTYLWSFQDSLDYFSVETSPYYIYNHPGKYSIVLQATDQYGCSAYDTTTITVLDVLNFFIPDAFSPNGDHNNQFFKPVYSTDLVTKVEGSIYNRWGEQVYHFTVPGDSWWEGKSDNQIAPEGVYFYQLKVTDLSSKVYNYKGTVTLIR